MAHERQRLLRDELNARFPRARGNLGQQMFRSAYYNSRMAGEPHARARSGSIAAVRAHLPDFNPIELEFEVG
jgi:hypothetical protein